MSALPIYHPQRSFVRLPGKETFHSSYRSTCPTCLRLCDAVRVLREDKVFGRKFCPQHGTSEVLLSADAAWFLQAQTCIKPGSIPLQHSTSVQHGCPKDCGLCPDHGQHSCLPIIEITDHCDMRCPICLVDNHQSTMLESGQFAQLVDGLVAKEGRLDTINLSGGEPTLHPQLLDLLDIAQRPEIARISISTNGLRLSKDPALCEALAEREVYVNLQFDGWDEEALSVLRGQEGLAEIKQRAIDNLVAAGAGFTLVFTAVQGVNHHRLCDALELLFHTDAILSLMVQPVALIQRSACLPAGIDPLQRLTIPKVIQHLADYSQGTLKIEDFVPLPCSHPACFALTYLLKTSDADYVPFPRFLDFERYLELLANRGTLKPDEKLEETFKDAIDDLWSGAHQVPDDARILKALKDAINRIYPEDRALQLKERLRLSEATVKTVFIHAFMDEHSFDLERVRKCCTHYTLPDGRLIPGCAHNVLGRGRLPDNQDAIK